MPYVIDDVVAYALLSANDSSSLTAEGTLASTGELSSTDAAADDDVVPMSLWKNTQELIEIRSILTCF